MRGSLIQRDRVVTALALTAITLLAWVDLLRMHAAMGMAGMADMRVWSVSDWLALFAMWAVMMAGMMLPAVAPVVLLVLETYRRKNDRRARLSAGAFVGGYVLAWTAFSALAAGAQVALHRAALVGADMTSRSTLLAGVILIGAGVYQWLPIKQACLRHCRAPLGFLVTEWREGIQGALVMGLRHGTFCVACCWALMALLFVVGVMNLLWVAAIAALVLVEKLAPRGPAIGYLAGVFLIVSGLFELTRGAIG